MSRIRTVTTYLPPWGEPGRRTAGPDEDAVTLAVEAGRAALDGTVPEEAAERVVLVTRDLPLIEGGSAAVLLAGLGLPADVEVVERLGGAPAALDAVLSARPKTLVLAADMQPAGAGAALTGASGLSLRPLRRLARSLPVRTRTPDGAVHDYDDPRLLRERGLKASLEQAAPDVGPDVVAGLPDKEARALCAGKPPRLPTLGASAALFALAETAVGGASGVVLAAEQASLTMAVTGEDAGAATVRRLEPEARAVPATRMTPGPPIPVSVAAYDRAFEPKVRWEAARCGTCGTFAHPPRHRCRGCGAEDGWGTVPLPRRADVYTCATVHMAVPGLASPYDLALVSLEDTDVRVLVRTTATAPGDLDIGHTGRMTLRRVAVRSGVPDYGYAFWPDGPGGADVPGTAAATHLDTGKEAAR
ncbi:zinc ribbon domain-containing protein [Streptomyces sp. NPDC059262]|uniref:zinc ribbon domain-containing protein n=1 Tax=Streptomyces sp. NPDC059262 TaxID=3346797 RepID=UPI0036B97A81